MSFLGVLGGIFKGAATGFVAGGPLGAIAGGVLGAAGSSGGGVKPAAALPSTALPVSFRPRNPSIISGALGVSRGFAPTVSMPGGSVPVFSPLAATPMVATGGGTGGGIVDSLTSCPRGFHAGKTRSLLHPLGGCVRNRRMNPANAKALRRSIRRIYGAEKMFRRILKVTHPGHTGRVGIKRARRRR